MWYIDGHKWNPDTYSQDIEDLSTNQATVMEVMGFSNENRGLIEGRCHRNPFFDTDTIGFGANTDQKRAENDAYRAEDAADEPTFGFEELFTKVPLAQQYVQGSFYIIDIDDPELVEHGEAYIHERLTSHLAEPMTWPESEWEPWMVYSFPNYGDRIFVDSLAHGMIPGAIIVEPQRQRMGLPYQWIGAPID